MTNRTETPPSQPTTRERAEAVLTGSKAPEPLDENPVKFSIEPGEPASEGAYKGQITRYRLRGLGEGAEDFEKMVNRFFSMEEHWDYQEPGDPAPALESFFEVGIESQHSILYKTSTLRFTPESLRAYAEDLRKKLEDPQLQKRIRAAYKLQNEIDKELISIHSELGATDDSLGYLDAKLGRQD